MSIRHRKSNVPVTTQTQFLECGKGTGPSWFWNESGVFGSAVTVSASSSEMVDEVVDKYTYRFRDCSHSSRTVHNWFNQNVNSFSNLDWSNICMATPIGSDTLVSEGKMIHASRIRAGVVGVPSIIDSCSVLNLNQHLTSPALPRSIYLGSKSDPYDLDFSIWMLLVDMVDLAHIWTRLSGRLNKMNRMLREARVQGKTAEELHNANLGIQFGLIPTVADIQEFLKALEVFSKSASDIQKLSDRLRKLRVKPQHLASERPSWEYKTQTIFEEHNLPCTATVTLRDPAEWHGSLYYQLKCPVARTVWEKIKLGIDIFGLLDANAAWDVVPFTFVIDWFINIGRHLHEVTPKLMPVDMKLIDYCESVKLSFNVEWKLDVPVRVCLPSSTFIDDGDARVRLVSDLVFCTESYVGFIRQRSAPRLVADSGPVMFRNPLSLKRLSISSSLVGQRNLRSAQVVVTPPIINRAIRQNWVARLERFLSKPEITREEILAFKARAKALHWEGRRRGGQIVWKIEPRKGAH